MPFKGFQTLSDSEKHEAAQFAAMAGFTFHAASHIWYADESQTVVLRLHSGADITIEPACEGGYA
jgi:hypothetical protein